MWSYPISIFLVSMNPLYHQEPSYYDLHRLITWLIVGAAFISASGVLIAIMLNIKTLEFKSYKYELIF